MASPRQLEIDRLPDSLAALRVISLEDARLGGDDVREPHRHDYHELIWIRRGRGEHLIDGEPVPVVERTVTVIGRGQVHVFRQGEGLFGRVVQFGEELLVGQRADRCAAAWLLTGSDAITVPVPDAEVARLDGLLETLASELENPADEQSVELRRHLLSVLLLWLERWNDAGGAAGRDVDSSDIRLQQRFARLLESEFAEHHDASHYADALAVPPAALSRALARVTGRATKELITDRVMLEAARLLRFTDFTVQEVAHRVGFDDPLYFSRAFKRRYGESPMAYRVLAAGRRGDPQAAAGT
jgi:AraC family transcriptional regulator, transcriptional activator of pobA